MRIVKILFNLCIACLTVSAASATTAFGQELSELVGEHGDTSQSQSRTDIKSCIDIKADSNTYTVCDTFYSSSDVDDPYLHVSMDKRVYNFGDKLILTVQQDREAKYKTLSTHFTLVTPTGTTLGNSTANAPAGFGQGKLVLDIDDELFDAGKCYNILVSMSYVETTSRTHSLVGICIAHDPVPSVTQPMLNVARITALENKTSMIETNTTKLSEILNSLKATVETLLDRVEQIASLIGSTPQPSEPLLSGTVYRDSNGNGQRDAGEQGVANITVLTVDLSDFTKVVRTTTDSSGMYEFTDLDAGSYLVQVEGIVGSPGFAYLTITDTTAQDLGVA